MFGKRLRRLRKKMGITQAKLAQKLGVSPSTIGMYEQGRREPDTTMLVKIADLFNISVDYLVNFKSKKYPKDVDEIAARIEFILKSNQSSKGNKTSISTETLNSIVQAVKEGIHKAFEDDE